MIHIVLHFAVPLLVTLAFCRDRRENAALLLVATMLVDIGHLLADPIDDPERCSIGFHPQQTLRAIAVYAALFAVPPLTGRKPRGRVFSPPHARWHFSAWGCRFT